MANVTFSGTSVPSLVVSSSGVVGSHCDSRDPPSALPGTIGASVAGGYDLMTYQRLASAIYAHPPAGAHLDPAVVAAAPPTPPGHPPLLPGQEPLLHGGNLELKETLGSLGSAWPYPMYYPYESLATYPFAPGYGMTFDATRRKNATRETTATLKAWLNEHKKNPYPTKGEKIMLAIITKMTLTQVSTWFANARRRLKKENKMTWEPRNKTDDDDDDDDFKDDMSSDNERRKDSDGDQNERTRSDVEVTSDERDMDRSSPHRLPSPPTTSGAQGLPPPSGGILLSSPVKPRIWSLADMASSSSPSPSSASSSAPSVFGASKLLHRPLHLETSPYGRPAVPSLNHRLASPQETLLQVYAKSLGFPPHAAAAAAAFPPLAGLNGLGSPLMPSSFTAEGLSPISPVVTGCTSLPFTVSRPVATRPIAPGSPASPLHHILPGGAKITPTSIPPPPGSPSSPRTEG